MPLQPPACAHPPAPARLTAPSGSERNCSERSSERSSSSRCVSDSRPSAERARRGGRRPPSPAQGTGRRHPPSARTAQLAHDDPNAFVRLAEAREHCHTAEASKQLYFRCYSNVLFRKFTCYSSSYSGRFSSGIAGIARAIPAIPQSWYFGIAGIAGHSYFPSYSAD